MQSWVRNANDWGANENVDDELRAELQNALHQWFTKVMPDTTRLHQSDRRKATQLQQHLELIVAYVKCEPASENGVPLPSLLASSFREHIAEILLQLMTKPATEYGRRMEWHTDPATLVGTTEKVVFKYPFTFRLPLLPVECQLLRKLACSDTDELYHLSKLIIQKVGKSAPKAEDKEHLSKDVVRPWLSEAVSRGKQPQSPLSYFRCVQDMFNLGVDPSSAFGSCLTQAAVVSSQQRSRGLQHFLAESDKISLLHESLQGQYKNAVVTKIHLQLQCATNVAELDRISEEILRGLCTQHGQVALSAKDT